MSEPGFAGLKDYQDKRICGFIIEMKYSPLMSLKKGRRTKSSWCCLRRLGIENGILRDGIF